MGALRVASVVLVLAAALSTLTACDTAAAPTAPDVLHSSAHTGPDDRYTTSGRVIRVVDGDTLIAAVGGRRETIRLIGIDTPETVKPHTPVQCFGPQASALTKSIAAPGRPIRIERDPVVGDTDRYGRILAYIWTGDPASLNERLITAGAAREYDFDDQPYRLRDQFRADETRARADRDGLWGQCTR